MTKNDIDLDNAFIVPQELINSVGSFLKKTGYNSGCYGWNWDCYKTNKYNIIIGYRNFPKCKKINNDDNFDKLLSIINKYVVNNEALFDYDLKFFIINQLIDEWIDGNV